METKRHFRFNDQLVDFSGKSILDYENEELTIFELEAKAGLLDQADDKHGFYSYMAYLARKELGTRQEALRELDDDSDEYFYEDDLDDISAHAENGELL